MRSTFKFCSTLKGTKTLALQGRGVHPSRMPFQFQKLGNNYNQVVKVINAHFSNIAIPHQIALPEQRTRELEALSIGIPSPAKRTAEWLRI